MNILLVLGVCLAFLVSMWTAGRNSKSHEH